MAAAGSQLGDTAPTRGLLASSGSQLAHGQEKKKMGKEKKKMVGDNVGENSESERERGSGLEVQIK